MQHLGDNGVVRAAGALRLSAAALHALERELEHLFERILALPGFAGAAVVGDRADLRAEPVHKPAQEKIVPVIVRERFERGGVHETVIGVVVNEIGAEELHQSVVPAGGGALEERIRRARGAHAADDAAAFFILLHHFVHRVDVVLQIGVDTDGDVAPGARPHEPRGESVLVAAVADLAQTGEMRVALVERADDAPRGVLRAVVHEDDAAFRRDGARVDQIAELFAKDRRRERQCLFLVVAGHDNIKDRKRFHEVFSFPNNIRQCAKY